jgi:hypothetical protein
VPRGSTRVGQVSKPLPRVTTLLVHVSTGGPHTCHVAAPEWATSAARCHVAPSHWSTSASGPHPGTSHLTGGPHLSATWQSFNGPPHPTLCHMAQLHQATSTQLCHMATHYSSTSVAVNQWSTSSQCMPHGTTTGGHLTKLMPHGTATATHISSESNPN